MNKSSIIIVGSGESVSDLRYASRLSTPDEFIYFSAAGDPALHGVVVSDLEYGRALKNCPENFIILNSAEIGRGSILKQLSALAGKYDFREFIVPEYFPLALADDLRAAGISVRVRRGVFFPEREFKSSDEIELIRRPLRAAEAALRRAREVVAAAGIGNNGELIAEDGEILTSEKLRFEINSVLLRFNCSGVGTIAAGALQSALPHHVGSGPLFARTPIVMDIFPRDEDTGYWGDLTRTIIRGKAPEHIRKAFDCVRKVRDEAQKLIRPGAIPSEIHRFAAESFEQAHFFTGRDEHGTCGFFHSLGHGVGLDIHENPRLGPGNHKKLAGGEVVTIEPGLYYPEWGGIRMENLAAVKSDGIELLTEIDDLFEV